MKISLITIVALASVLVVMPTASASAGANRRLLQGTVHTIDPWTVGIMYPDLNLAAGTAVKFVWSGGHGVAKIPSGACPTAFNGPGISVVAPIAPSGTYTTPPLAAGTYWYTCPVIGHCDDGQLQKIIVA